MSIFAALADPHRQRIVEMLVEGEMSAGDIAEKFEVTGPAISQHLKALREAGVVTVRAEAQKRIYALNPEAFAELGDWLRRFQLLSAAQTNPAAPPTAEGWEAILHRLGV